MFNDLIKNIMNLGIITASDVERLTATELMLLIIERCNGLLEGLKSTNEVVGELETKYNQLKDALEQETAEAVIELLNQWLIDGTLEELINQELLSDVKSLKTNSKYMLELYCGDAGRQSIDYVTNHIKNGKKAGFKEICLLIYLQSDGTTLENLSLFPQYNQIARDLDMPITCLKLHGVHTIPNYLDTLYDGLSKLPDVNTVFVFNEQFKLVYDNGINLPRQIKLEYPQVKKVGCTVDYGTAFKDWTAQSADEMDMIQSQYDILGVHMYPSCGNFENARRTSYEQCIKAFNEFELLIPWKKEIWITESGVLPYWQFLELPENYEISNLTDKERTIGGQRLFYRALSNCKMAQQAEIIIPWYTESWNYIDTTEMWNEIRNIIKNN